MLTKEQILASDDLKPVKVEVPEWGGEVFIRNMTAAERDHFESSVIQGNKQNMKNLRSRLVVLCAVDESGKRIFNDSDADALGKKSAAAVDRLFTAASKHNGFSSKDIEELEGE